ncbi:cytoplasmic dynein 2 light intermediate chain 1 [Patella vulgata]|uniref:cytoplasmic dynein 2 light intermediate chain 1 n=1 Tax=Patella vulgata TaxID=6465 RepID=UPI0024A8801E|nr:cytoplasmic dynein 2 light intermediate chain 1 [Patella vulgata]XP_050406961.2 cytoplasmic dynein 2 light intermediate chain 1 [Patella vulgata]
MEKNLWELALDQEKEKEEAHNTDESAVFLCGSKNAGKTSIILRFLDRDEAPKPTVALEYTFGRRAKGHNIAKDVGHIWELGGGTWLSKLMDIPLNPSTLLHTTLVLVLDLSAPNEMWFTLETLMTAARARIDSCISEMKADDSKIREKLHKKAWERVGEDHPDKNMLDPMLIPLVIIGTKFDVFQDMDSEKRKVITKTLRFVSHVYGASLQFFSIKQEQLISKTRGLISHHLFETTASKTLQTDYNKPLQVPAGLDSLQQIGNPPLSEQDIGRVHAKNPMELWKVAFTGFFPQENTNNPGTVKDPAKDAQFAEPSIDKLRMQKDGELDNYRRLSERRAKERNSTEVYV